MTYKGGIHMVRRVFFRFASIIVSLILILIGVYAGLNAYLFTFGENANGVAVAAWSAFASLFFVVAIFIMVAQGISTMNTHLEHISDAADEQVKLLRYLAKQNQPRQ
jgi:xanthine/uracil permease